MRIVFYTQEFCIKYGDPCTHRIDSLASYLSENGHDVTILTGTHNKKREYPVIDRKYKVIYSGTIAFKKKTVLYRLIRNMSFATTSFFKGIFCIRKTDVLITTTPPPLVSYTGYFLARIKRAKFIYDVRDIWPDIALEMGSFTKKSIYYKVFNFIANRMYKHADYITTVTPSKVTKLIEKCHNKNKVWYIPNGLDDNFLGFKDNEKIIDTYELKDKWTVSYVGNVGLAQNMDILIDLAEKNKNKKDIQFLIFGEGAYKDILLTKVKGKKLNNVFIEDRINYSDVYTILKYSKLSFVSLKNMNLLDSVPTKIFDALGVGCPVLLYAKGDSVDILNETKLGETATDFEELCKKFDSIYNHYDKYEKKKEKGIKYILSNYSRKKIAQKFEEYLMKYVK